MTDAPVLMTSRQAIAYVSFLERIAGSGRGRVASYYRMAAAAMMVAVLGACSAPDGFHGDLGQTTYVYPGHAASVDALRQCGGPYLEWDVHVDHTPWPYTTTRSETMRCLKDGRIVGPYTYRTDGLDGQ